jgi:methionine sulfoxide reductase heme-binding subunit
MAVAIDRYWKRRIRQHGIILLATASGALIFWMLFSDRRDVISRFSVATAYPALFLAAAALLIGPWNVLTNRPNPVSFDLRRDLGIWAGLMALFHSVVGLNVHLRGRMWLYFVDERTRLRHDLFGFSNDTGAVASLLFLLLLMISNDISLRKLGTYRWKFLQRGTYVAVALTFLHAIAYQNIEKRQLAYRLVFWSTALVVCGMQFAGWRTRRRAGTI